MLTTVLGFVVGATFTVLVVNEDKTPSVSDVGLEAEQRLTQQSQQLFGIV